MSSLTVSEIINGHEKRMAVKTLKKFALTAGATLAVTVAAIVVINKIDSKIPYAD